MIKRSFNVLATRLRDCFGGEALAARGETIAQASCILHLIECEIWKCWDVSLNTAAV